MSFVSNFRRWSGREGCPITIGILSCLVVSTLVLFFVPHLQATFVLMPPKSPVTALATYWLAGHSIAGFSIIFFIMMLAWTLNMGGSVERDLGQQKYAAFMAISILLPSILWYVAATILHIEAALASFLLPLAMLTVAWCSRHAEAPMCFWGMTIAAKWFGWLMVVIVFTSFGFGAPLMGVVACLPLTFAFAFATNRIPGFAYAGNVFKAKKSKTAQAKENEYFTSVKDRERERTERERLRKLFENSMNDDK